MLVFLLIAALILLDYHDVFSIVVGVATAAFSVVVLWLALRMGVVVDQRGVRLRQIGRGRFIPWAGITGIRCQ